MYQQEEHSDFGEGIGPVHLLRAGCTSEDMNLLNCTIDMSAVNGCNHSEDAGVICSGGHMCIMIACHLYGPSKKPNSFM